MSLHTQRGFSLTELMIVLAISSVVVTGMYGAFVQQQRVSTQQEQLTEARQNVRLSMDAMIEEIREAGFDPGGLAGAGIVEADFTHIRFTRDLNCNGTLASSDPAGPGNKNFRDAPPNRTTSDEDIAYTLDTTSQELSRQVYVDGQKAPGGTQPMASNIIGRNFCYILCVPLNGTCDVDVPLNGPCLLNPATDNFGNIRAVQITLTAKATASDPNYTDPNDTSLDKHYHKATLTSLVRLRNLGLNRGMNSDGTSQVLDSFEICPLP